MTEVEVTKETYIDKIHDWNNDDNLQYYENLPLETFQKYAQLAGLDTYCDLELIRPQIMQANSILEVAAGYGRVLDGLTQMGYQNRVVAIERCAKSYQHLKTATEKKPHIHAMHSDIRNFDSAEKFDLILFLWTGLCEFTSAEQFSILANLSCSLKPNAFIVVDSMPVSLVPLNAEWLSGQQAVFRSGENSFLYEYILSKEDIDSYANKLHLRVQHLPYVTTTNRPRILYLISQANV
jgi:SAM-dependent methyltransferase